MKKILFLLTVALAAMQLSAATVDQATAMRKAKSYLTNELYAGKMMAPAALNPVLLKAEVGNSKTGKPVYYIYNTSTTFLVVAGDDRAEEILMVGDAPLKDINNLAPGMQDVLSIYKEEIDFLHDNPSIQVQKMSDLNTNKLRAVTYGPLLTATWDQTAPYWNQCKFTYSGTTYQCYTGCPATSASMVLYYWKYPASVSAMPSYTSTLDISSSRSVSFTYPALSATTFDWNNMKDSYSSYTTAQGTAVATLMRYVGQAEEMMYGTASAGGSGIYNTNSEIIATMFKNWGYSSNTRLVNKSSYSSTNWANLIIAEMAASRPVVYLGVSTSGGGHAFNVDGYRDSDSKYHVNFGWSGDGNSWYSMNSFSYNGYTFSSSQQAIIGIEPAGEVLHPALTVNPTSLSFTDCTNGETYTKTFTVSGADLSENVSISVSSSSGYYTVSPTTLTAAQAMAGATVTVTFKPTATGTSTGTVTVASSGATSQTVSLTGTSTPAAATPTMTVDPTSLSFSTEVGTPVTKTFTLTGTNTTAYAALSVTGDGFSINKTRVTNAAMQSGATVTVTYNPTAAGNHTGSITITSTGAETVTIPLTGTATAPVRSITANPTSLTFNGMVGETATQTFNVTGTNLTGALTLTLNNGNGIYSITPTTLTADQAQAGATVTVTYAPTTFGTSNATVTISGGGAEAVTVSLNGQANLVKYAPVMLPAVEEYINLTQFRADWTDETPAANVTSYTLEVTPKAVTPEVELIGSVAGTDFSGSTYYDITLPAPWGGNNLRGANSRAIYFRQKGYQNATLEGQITYTIPEGYENMTFTMKITTDNTTDGAGNFTVATPQTAAVGHTFTAGETYSWVVTASAGEMITITSTQASYSPDIAKIEVYTGDATAVTLMAIETGDENSRLITGITDKFYTVENLAAAGTFLYRVKAVYQDGTESDWSNIEEVTLFENGHGYDLGDVNHDGEVTIKDVTVLIDYLLDSENNTVCPICADVSGDSEVTIKDVTDLIDMLLGNTATLNMGGVR